MGPLRRMETTFRVLRVFLQDLKETRVDAGAGAGAGAGVVSEHALVPEDGDEIERRRRGWRSGWIGESGTIESDIWV